MKNALVVTELSKFIDWPETGFWEARQSAVASCDDLANLASHRDFLLARKRDTLLADCLPTKGGFIASSVKGWLIGRQSQCWRSPSCDVPGSTSRLIPVIPFYAETQAVAETVETVPEVRIRL